MSINALRRIKSPYGMAVISKNNSTTAVANPISIFSETNKDLKSIASIQAPEPLTSSKSKADKP